MSPNDRKLVKFIDTIMQDANARSAEIMSEIDDKRSAFLAASEEELIAEMYEHIRGKVNEAKTDAGRRISQKTLENKKALYGCMSEIKADVLEKVESRIRDYVKTPEYLSDLGKMTAYVSRFLDADDIIIMLRPEDMKYKETLSTVTPAVYSEGDLKLGGLIAVSSLRNLRLDLSYDTSLSEASRKFGEVTGLYL